MPALTSRLRKSSRYVKNHKNFKRLEYSYVPRPQLYLLKVDYRKFYYKHTMEKNNKFQKILLYFEN